MLEMMLLRLLRSYVYDIYLFIIAEQRCPWKTFSRSASFTPDPFLARRALSPVASNLSLHHLTRRTHITCESLCYSSSSLPTAS